MVSSLLVIVGRYYTPLASLVEYEVYVLLATRVSCKPLFKFRFLTVASQHGDLLENRATDSPKSPNQLRKKSMCRPTFYAEDLSRVQCLKFILILYIE